MRTDTARLVNGQLNDQTVIMNQFSDWCGNLLKSLDAMSDKGIPTPLFPLARNERLFTVISLGGFDRKEEEN